MGILATGPLFSIALTGYFLMGFGTGLSDAGFCAWAANVPYASVVQGFMHGSYSVGSILGPLLANLMLKNVHEWYEFYRMTVSQVDHHHRHHNNNHNHLHLPLYLFVDSQEGCPPPSRACGSRPGVSSGPWRFKKQKP